MVPVLCIAKVSEVVDREATGMDTPVPESDIACRAPFWASSVTVKVPVREPEAVGTKTRVTTQLAPAVTGDPQLLDCEKSPVTEMELMFSTIEPLLEIVTIDAAELVPTLVVLKLKLVGEKATVDMPPVPVRKTCCVLPLAAPESSVIVMASLNAVA